MKRDDIETGETYEIRTKPDGQYDTGFKFTAIVMDRHSTYEWGDYTYNSDTGKYEYKELRGIRVMPVIVPEPGYGYRGYKSEYPTVKFPGQPRLTEIMAGGDIVIPTKCVVRHTDDVMLEEAYHMNATYEHRKQRDREEREREELKGRATNLGLRTMFFGDRESRDSACSRNVRLSEEVLDEIERGICAKYGIEPDLDKA